MASILPNSTSPNANEESSESDNETEPAKIFHRRVSTKKDINTSAATKEGFLMKQTWSFQRWRRRYFRLKGHKLYYAKDLKQEVFDEIDLSNLCFAECSTKNVNHSFQVITPTRSLVLCAESRREMEEWLSALKAASSREYYEPGPPDQHDFLSNHHHWYATSHARPTYCNVCRDALSGVTSHGLSCEVCKCKVHKRCAAKAISNCKWTTLATVGKDIIEDQDGNIVMPHQWMEGNLPVASTCKICKKTCGSVLRLQDWRCLWCRTTVHTACRPQMKVKCPLGSAQVSVVPPTSVHSIGLDEAWDIVKPHGSYSPLLVFVNSKSGDNQGVKFLRRFKQLLNPAQVFDLVSSGPGLGLRLFRHFDPFRILVCSGDGSVGWVLSEMDRLDMTKQCQLAVLPLGTGNDLSRVLGWGSSCDDDAHLPQILERYETASTKMLDRWSIMVFEKACALKTPKMSISNPSDTLLNTFVELANSHLQSIVETDDFQIVINATKNLCETVNELLSKITENSGEDEQMGVKCDILRQKLDMLIETLKDDESGTQMDDDLMKTINNLAKKGAAERPLDSTHKSIGKIEKDKLNSKERRFSRIIRSTEKEALQCRANSLKRAIHNIIEHNDMLRIHDNKHFSTDNLMVHHTVSISSSTETTPRMSPVPSIGTTTITTKNFSSTTPPPPPPPINIISPSVSTTQLTCISPVPDQQRRDSMDEYFFNSLNLPVPRQFADGSSRRSSGVPESIQEQDENSVMNNEFILKYETTTLTTGSSQSLSPSTIILHQSQQQQQQQQQPLQFTESQLLTTESDSSETFRNEYSLVTSNLDYLGYSHLEQRDDEYGIIPYEVYERNLLRIKQQNIEFNSSNLGLLQVPVVIMPGLEIERPPPPGQVYTSDNITIIDTDVPERSSSDEGQGEASDVLSAISNEECSLTSEILDKQNDTNSEQYSQIHVADIIQDLETDQLGHIDSPETSDTTDALHGESLIDDISSVLGHDILGALQDITITDDTTTLCTDKPHQQLQQQQQQRKRSVKSKKYLDRLDSDDLEQPPQFGFENIVFDMDNRCDDQKAGNEPIRYCSLAHFVEGNDIARKSFKRPNRNKSASLSKSKPSIIESTNYLESIEIQIQGSHSDLSETETLRQSTIDVKHISFDDSCKKDDGDEKQFTQVSVFIEPPSPEIGHDNRMQRVNEIRRHSSHSTSLTVKEYDKEKDRRHSGINPNLLGGLDTEHMRFLSCSPAATRRISCGSLFKPNEPSQLGSSKSSLFAGSSLTFSFDKHSKEDKVNKDDADKDKCDNKKLPIINPLVRLPSWPNVTAGSGFVSKCLMANADTLCAAVSPLMDPDETLLEGYYEKCVMNNYFGIGIDAKISLDFHNKREEHPEKCRSRAKNYYWYGVLGSKQWLQKTYKNLEQRVQLECDGQRIPLPSLQGIVILNIPSFMGGTNFWGGKKENDCFLAPSFDDRILEVVAVFGSVQMAASRLINLQHHRIAQCQSVQINILGDERVPIQVDGEAWLQPPGMIRIIHKNRVQMLCRNRNLEISLKAWQEKQRQHSISIAREQTSTISECSVTASTDGIFSERESYLLLNFIECSSTLVKWVKILMISQPTLEHNLYAVACRTADSLEAIHPNGKIIEGSNLRTQLSDLINVTRQLYEDACELLRERGNTLSIREDLETKLSAALANMEMELRKCTVQVCSDGQTRGFLNVLAPNEEPESRKKSKPFWLRFRGSGCVGSGGSGGTSGGVGVTNITCTGTTSSVCGGTTGCSNVGSGDSSGQSSVVSVTSNITMKPSVTYTQEQVMAWTAEEVIVWLETMQLSEYNDSFIKNDIQGKELITLGRRDLKDLGVIKVGHVKRILQAIKDIGSS